jgi:hypothetical protein
MKESPMRLLIYTLFLWLLFSHLPVDAQPNTLDFRHTITKL